MVESRPGGKTSEMDDSMRPNEPLSLHRRRRSSDRGVLGDERPDDPGLRLLDLGAVELVASPFTSFREVGRFQQALASIPSVRSVHPRQLGRGALHLRVNCQVSADLTTALEAAYDVPFRVVAQSAYRLEIAFEEPATAAEGAGA